MLQWGYRGIPWEVGRKNVKLSDAQKAILYGIILGDGYLQPTGAKNARLRLEHSHIQEKYLRWKMAQLPMLFQGEPTKMSRLHPKSQVTYQYVRAQSNASPDLGKLRMHYYPSGKKRIPENLRQYLSPLTMAVWYMDDGYYYLRDKCAYLYLGRVTMEEAKTVQQSFESELSLDTAILDKKKKGFVIYFSPTQVAKLKKIILPYILPEFLYKLPS